MLRTMAALGAALIAGALAGAAPALAGGTIALADIAELSGSGATVGTNWKNGIDLAVDEINAAGGILGAKIVVTHADTQSNAGVAKAQAQKALDDEPYALLGPGYSGSVKVCAPLAQEAGVAEIMGGEAAELTRAGNKFLFRTSFGQQTSMPKIAKYIAETLKARTAAVVWVNNDFGKGGHDTILKEFAARGVKVVADDFDRGGPGRFRRRRAESEGRRSGRRVPLSQRGGERAHPQGAAQGRREGAAGRRDHADRPEGDRTRRARPPMARSAMSASRRTRRCRRSRRSGRNSSRNIITCRITTASRAISAVYMIKAATEKMGGSTPRASPRRCTASPSPRTSSPASSWT